MIIMSDVKIRGVPVYKRGKPGNVLAQAGCYIKEL
jgi:hypothetical protein